MKNIACIILIALAFSCKKSESIPEKTVVKAETKVITSDTLYRLLDTAINKDSLDFDNDEPFLHLKAGKFLSPEVKNAFLVSNVKDSILKLELYTQISGKWVKNDEQTITDSSFHLPMFELTFADYNFDGQKDIFLPTSASQGYSLTRGHLIIIDPKNLKMELHPETRDYGSMVPDKAKKVVYSYIKKCYDPKEGPLPPCRVINKWKDNKLVFVSMEECPCAKITK